MVPGQSPVFFQRPPKYLPAFIIQKFAGFSDSLLQSAMVLLYRRQWIAKSCLPFLFLYPQKFKKGRIPQDQLTNEPETGYD